MTNQKWTLETIKLGIDRFINDEGRPPTAVDFDRASDLPSARQIQRLYGGMVGLRTSLGYKDLDFTKGDLRKVIALKAFTDGLNAEEEFEKILVDKFGEPFVHTQKRYSQGTKNRYDFFIYARNTCFGIDVFTTHRKEYIGPNLRHKVERYKSTTNVPVYFVVMGSEYSNSDITKVVASTQIHSKYSHMKLMNESQFLQHISTIEPLKLPERYKGIQNNIEQN